MAVDDLPECDTILSATGGSWCDRTEDVNVRVLVQRKGTESLYYLRLCWECALHVHDTLRETFPGGAFVIAIDQAVYGGRDLLLAEYAEHRATL